MAHSFFFSLGGSLNCSEISDCWSVWEMEHNYCRSVSTNGWLVGNSVMTECAQVGCNRVLNEWCRLHTHPPQCRCRLQQLPSGQLIHRDHVFSTRGTKKGWCTQNNMMQWWFTSSVSMQSWKPQLIKGEIVLASSELLSEITVLLDGALVLILAVFTPPVTLSCLSHVCDPPLNASLDPSWRFLRVICACVLKLAQMDGNRAPVQYIQRKNPMFHSQILSLQPPHPSPLLDTHQLSKDFRIASR